MSTSTLREPNENYYHQSEKCREPKKKQRRDEIDFANDDDEGRQVEARTRLQVKLSFELANRMIRKKEKMRRKNMKNIFFFPPQTGSMPEKCDNFAVRRLRNCDESRDTEKTMTTDDPDDDKFFLVSDYSRYIHRLFEWST